MLSSFSILAGVHTLVALYVALLLPGQGWWRQVDSALPTLFARIALSVAVTSFAGLLLTAFDQFSLANVVLFNGAFGLCGFLYQLLGRRYEPTVPPPAPEYLGPVMALGCLAAYWPAYDVFFYGGDATMYVNAGVHLASTGHLWVEDSLVGEFSALLTAVLFPSVNHALVVEPPYSRTIGGLVSMTLGADRAWPGFFPLPSVWAGMYSAALGARSAPAFAGLFCALGVWATYVVARYLLPLAAAVLVAVLAATNGIACWYGHFPVSEPVVWFFLWAGLAALIAWEKQRFPADAAMAGLLLGCCVMTRPEYFLFFVGIFALRTLLGGPTNSNALPWLLLLGSALPLLATAIEIQRLPGAYLQPLTESAGSAALQFSSAVQNNPLAFCLVSLASLGACFLVARQTGLKALVLLAAVIFPALASTISVQFQGHYTVTWLGLYAGWSAVSLATLGVLWFGLSRRDHPEWITPLAFLVVLAAPLLWHPHVYLQIPWGARRLLPFLLPGTFLFAVGTVTRLGQRWIPLGAAGSIVLVLGIWPAAQATWGVEFFDHSVEQLEQLKAVIPDDAIVTVDRQLVSYMLDTPLWLIYGVDTVPVHTTSAYIGGLQVSAIAARLGDRRPVYHLRPALNGAPQPVVDLRFEKKARIPFNRLLFEASTLTLPQKRKRWNTYVDVYQVTHSRWISQRTQAAEAVAADPQQEPARPDPRAASTPD